jgi:hypothetical protein
MPDTGAPWNIPYVETADLVSDWPADSLALANAIAAALSDTGGYDSSTLITASDATWSVPSLADPIVKVTVIGGGGGGGSADSANGGTGGTSSFNAGGAGTISATGGAGGKQGNGNTAGRTATLGNSAGNDGGGAIRRSATQFGSDGAGGSITVGYLDLTGITTVNATVGAGGSAGTGTINGSAGGRGEILVEYRAS